MMAEEGPQRPRTAQKSYYEHEYAGSTPEVTKQSQQDFRKAAENVIRKVTIQTMGELPFKHVRPQDIKSAVDELCETLKPGTNTKSIEAWESVLTGQKEIQMVAEKLRQGKYHTHIWHH